MILRRFFVVVSLLWLAACSTEDQFLLNDLRRATGFEAGAPRNLDPAFSYLRAVIEGRIVYLALGNVDADENGLIEVWYSAGREVLRLQNGRIMGATGLFSEWRQVFLPKLPPWQSLAEAQQPYSWTRVRDAMPGYRYGVRDRLVLKRISVPEKSNLSALDPASLAWFEEDDEGNKLPPAKYALQNGTVVYAESCLDPGFCFSWQRWRAGEGQ